MPKQVGVFNAPPVYVSGLADALQNSSFVVTVVTDAGAWFKDHDEKVLLMMINEPGDLDLVVDLREHAPHSPLITLLDPVTADGVAASLRAGATGSVGLFFSSDEVVLAIEAASEEKIVLSARLARSMMKNSMTEVDPRILSQTDVECLQALAAGERVTDLARRFSYSEREMYRRLRRLYSRMSVRGRAGALVLAARWGIID